MRSLLQATLCFVFVAQCLSQGYVGRSRTPVHPKPVYPDPKPVYPSPVINQTPQFMGGSVITGPIGMHNDFDERMIQELIGSTVAGRPLRWGETINGVALPEHGGTLNPDGLFNGFGAVNPNGALPNDGWQHPWNNMPYPRDFSGQILVFDDAAGRYVYEHQLKKASHNVQKATGGNLVDPVTHDIKKAVVGGSGIGADPITHNIVKAEAVQHNIAKDIAQQQHMDMKTGGMIGGGHVGGGHIGGPIVDPVGHNYVKAEAVQHNIAKDIAQQQHMNMKTGGMIGGGIVGGGHVGGHIVDPVGHNFAKAEAVQHNIAKDIAQQQHMNMKTGGIIVGNPVVSPVVHNIAKAEAVQHDIAKDMGHFGGQAIHPVVHNIAKSEAAGGHFVDPFSHNYAKNEVIEHNIAKDVAQAQHMTGVVGGPIVNPVVHNIAKVEAVQHNAIKSGVSPIMAGKPIFNQGQVIHHNMPLGGQGFGMPHGGGVHGGIFPNQDVVHNVEKVSSGVAAHVATDRAASDLGQFIAASAIGNAADIVNFGSGGAQAAGNIFANDATARLAMEGLHIGKKSIAVASGIAPPVKPDMPHALPVAPVLPQVPRTFPTGYGGRQRG